jgi:hypothetical protein
VLKENVFPASGAAYSECTALSIDVENAFNRIMKVLFFASNNTHR